MPFIIFEVLLAAVALGLVAVLALIARQLWEKRQHPEPKPQAVAPSQPGRKLPGLGRRREQPADKLSATPPVRKRQLRPLSEIEQGDADEAAELAAASAVARAMEDRTSSRAVLIRLEVAFDELQAGELTLERYRALITAEQPALDERVTALQPAGDSPELADALAALEAVRWCHDWADEQEREQKSA